MPRTAKEKKKTSRGTPAKGRIHSHARQRGQPNTASRSTGKDIATLRNGGFSALSFRPEVKYSAQVFSANNEHLALSHPLEKLKLMRRILGSFRDQPGFEPPMVKEHASIDEVLNMLTSYILEYCKKDKVINDVELVMDSKGKYHFRLGFGSQHYGLGHLPLFYLPWIEKHHPALFDVWIKGLGVVRRTGCLSLDAFTKGQIMWELEDYYSPDNQEGYNEFGDENSDYKEKWREAKAFYGKKGPVCRYADMISRATPKQWTKAYKAFQPKAGIEAEFIPLLALINIIAKADLTLDDEYLDESNEDAMDMLQPSMQWAMLWCDDPEKDLLTHILHQDVDSIQQGFGVQDCIKYNHLTLGYRFTRPEFNLASLMDDLFDRGYKLATTHFIYKAYGKVEPSPNLTSILTLHNNAEQHIEITV